MDEIELPIYRYKVINSQTKELIETFIDVDSVKAHAFADLKNLELGTEHYIVTF